MAVPHVDAGTAIFFFTTECRPLTQGWHSAFGPRAGDAHALFKLCLLMFKFP